MKIGKVINLKDFSSIFNFLKQNKYIIISMILFIIGFIFGIFSLLRFEGFKNFFESKLQNFFILRNKGDILDISLSSFGFYLNILISVFIVGTSVLGVVFLPFILFGYGLYYGALLSLLYSEYSLNGVVLSGIVILPSAVLFAVCLIFATKEAADFSISISSLTLPKSAPSSLYYNFKRYCSNFIKILTVTIISSLLDGFLSFYLIEKFSF